MPQPFDPVNVTFAPSSTTAFPNGVRPGLTLREFYNALISTSQPAESPTFGGVEDTMPHRCNELLLSDPFGNCGQLNSAGAAALAHFYDTIYRARYSPGHVIMEVLLFGTWYVVETYAPGQLVRPQDDANECPFYTMAELLPGPPSGEFSNTWVPNNPIWNGVPLGVQSLYSGGVFALQPNHPTKTYKDWRSAVLTLNARETGLLRRSAVKAHHLIGVGNLDPNSSPNLTGWPINEAVIERDNLGTIEHIEHPFLLSKIELVLKPNNGGLSTIVPLMANDAVKVIPVPPTWAMRLPTNYWAVDPVSAFGGDIGGWHLSPSTYWWTGTQPYTNNTAQVQNIWVPMIYRTEKPTPPGVGLPVGSVNAVDYQWNLYTRSRSIQFAEFIVALPPGRSLNFTLTTHPNKAIELHHIGEHVADRNISDILSHNNPARAVDVDLSGLTAQERAAIKLRYTLMVNAYLTL